MTELSLEIIDVKTGKRQIKNEEKPVRISIKSVTVISILKGCKTFEECS